MTKKISKIVHDTASTVPNMPQY